MILLSNEIQSDFDTLLDKGEKYLLAFSGGPDSVYLLWMLSLYYGENLRNHILLCYINYHDSPFVNEEEKIVDHYIDCFHLESIKNDIHYNEKEDRNFEEWARNYRYDLFLRIVQDRNLCGVLTAHQKTDVVETYLLQKDRGNLPLHYGLKKKNNLYGLEIIRPLLSITKKELTRQLDENHITYYFDITNTNLKKKRNKIRNDLDEEMIEKTITVIDDENAKLREIYSFFETKKDGMMFSEYDSLSDENQRRYCFYLLDQIKGTQRRQANGKLLFDFLKRHANGRLALSEDIYCYRTGKLFFLSMDMEKISYSMDILSLGFYENEYISIDLGDITLFNLRKLPVTIRNYRQGDRISTDLPTKDIRKALQKQSVPFYLLSSYPVFVQDGKIISVPFYSDLRKGKIPMKLKMER